MLGLAGLLFPTRPRTAVWLATREPAAGELRRVVLFARRDLWPQIGWFALGVLAANAAPRVRAALSDLWSPDAADGPAAASPAAKAPVADQVPAAAAAA